MDDARPAAGQLSPDRRWRWDGSRWVPHAPPESARPPDWAGLGLRRAADWRALLIAAVVALILDQWLRSARFGLAAALTVLAAATGLLLSRHLASRQGIALVAIAPTFGVWFALRASPWLLWPDLVISAGLLLTGAGLAAGRSIFDLAFPDVLRRSLHGAFHLGAAPAYLASVLARAPLRLIGRAPASLALLRGLLLATPIVIVLGLLLASADPIFASFFQINFDPGAIVLDAFYVGLGLWAMAGLLRFASSETLALAGEPQRRLGLEALVVLAAVDAIFLVFAAAQAVGASGAGQETLRAAGVTYADYARSGFFQLLWVAGLTLVVLMLVGALVDRSRPRTRRLFLLLAELAVVLTLMVVAVSFRRLQLYEEAYGLSMLRLYSHVFAVWIGIVFVLLGVALAGLGASRHWFVGVAVGVGMVGLLALNLANPEVLVVELNLAQAQTSGRLDGDYLRSLSDDAVPGLAGDGAGRPIVCGGSRSYDPGWAGFNLASWQAAQARRQNC